MTYGIVAKTTTRYYAPFVNRSGGVSRKGYGTRKGAAEHIAKEFLLDCLHGEKYHHPDSNGGWGWYARDWDLGLMKHVFDCEFTDGEGIVEHNATAVGWGGERGDPLLCQEEGGKEFCAAAWKKAVRDVGQAILAGREPVCPEWILERKATYVRSAGNEPCILNEVVK